MTNCIHGDPEPFAPDSIIKRIPECQGTAARHKCPVCAYNAGVAVGKGELTFNGNASQCKHEASMPAELIDQLPTYQSRDGRHGCVHIAYQAGLIEGKLIKG